VRREEIRVYNDTINKISFSSHVSIMMSEEKLDIYTMGVMRQNAPNGNCLFLGKGG
jgi:hypothetical protein